MRIITSMFKQKSVFKKGMCVVLVFIMTALSILPAFAVVPDAQEEFLFEATNETALVLDAQEESDVQEELDAQEGQEELSLEATASAESASALSAQSTSARTGDRAGAWWPLESSGYTMFSMGHRGNAGSQVGFGSPFIISDVGNLGRGGPQNRPGRITQIGVGNLFHDPNNFRREASPDDWVFVAAGQGGSKAINAAGYAYTWGPVISTRGMGRGGSPVIHQGIYNEPTRMFRYSTGGAYRWDYISIGSSGAGGIPSGGNGGVLANPNRSLLMWGQTAVVMSDGSQQPSGALANAAINGAPLPSVLRRVTPPSNPDYDYLIPFRHVAIGVPFWSHSFGLGHINDPRYSAPRLQVGCTVTFAVSDNGHLYSWGGYSPNVPLSHMAGALGRNVVNANSTNSWRQPWRVPMPDGAVRDNWYRVAIGGGRMPGDAAAWPGDDSPGIHDTLVVGMAINEEGHLYSWGTTNSRLSALPMLGRTPDANNPINRLGRVQGIPPVADVVMSGRTVAALTRCGHIYTWGITNLNPATNAVDLDNLGRAVNAANPADQPRRIQGPLGAGTYWTAIGGGWEYFHSICSNERLYSWGRNREGQLGLGDYVNRNRPTLVECVIDVKGVSRGFGLHTLFLARTPAVLEVSKEVEGQFADRSTEFRFDLTLTVPQGGSALPPPPFAGIITDSGGSPVAPPRGNVTIDLAADFRSATAYFYLRCGETLTIEGLPVGTRWNVVEAARQEFAPQVYVHVGGNEPVRIPNINPPTNNFNTALSTGNRYIVSSRNVAEFINRQPYSPPMGLAVGSNVPYVVIIVIGLASLGVVTLNVRRRMDDLTFVGLGEPSYTKGTRDTREPLTKVRAPELSSVRELAKKGVRPLTSVMNTLFK